MKMQWAGAWETNDYYFWPNVEQMIQEFVLDGTMMQVRLEVIGRVFLHSIATDCQLHACFWFNRTICMQFFIHSSYKQHLSITIIKLVCASLEWNVLSRYITPRKTAWFHCHRPDVRGSATYRASSIGTSLEYCITILWIFCGDSTHFQPEAESTFMSLYYCSHLASKFILFTFRSTGHLQIFIHGIIIQHLQYIKSKQKDCKHSLYIHKRCDLVTVDKFQSIVNLKELSKTDLFCYDMYW